MSISNTDPLEKVGSDLLGYEHCKCPMGSHDLWKYPFYEFIIDNNHREHSEPYQRVVIRVTDSAIYTKPKISKEQAKTIDNIETELPKNPTVIDFGAGKLRTTNYMLDKKYTVYPVEFEELKDRTEGIKKIYKEAIRHSVKCKPLSYPDQFFSENVKADLIIAINVHNVMPIPAERLISILYARMKLKKNGFYLYFGQHDVPSVMENYNNYALGDGCFNNLNTTYQTFYHNFTIDELDSMFLMNGFRFYKKYSVGGTNHARLYKISSNNSLERVLDAETILKYIESGKNVDKKTAENIFLENTDGLIVNDPLVEELAVETLMINALKKIPPGRKYSTEYHNLISAIFMRLFSPSLIHFELEFKIKDGDERIDIMAENNAESGFFKNLSKKNIDSGYIIMECKNYTNNLKNAEIFQSVVRLNKHTGMFGILAYRNDSDIKYHNKLIKKLKAFVKDDNKHILCLNDNDIEELLILKRGGDDIDELLNKKLKEIKL